MGVPVSSKRAKHFSRLHIAVISASGFRIKWPSSNTTANHRMESRVGYFLKIVVIYYIIIIIITIIITL
jgi:hypothetical protein